MLGELAIGNSKDVDVLPRDLASSYRHPGEQRHSRGFVHAAHRDVHTCVLVVAKQMMEVSAGSEPVKLFETTSQLAIKPSP
jgi:hypothetical protein